LQNPEAPLLQNSGSERGRRLLHNHDFATYLLRAFICLYSIVSIDSILCYVRRKNTIFSNVRQCVTLEYGARSVLTAAAESSSIYIIIICAREDDQPPLCHYLTTDLRNDPTMQCFIFRPLHMIPIISYHPTSASIRTCSTDSHGCSIRTTVR